MKEALIDTDIISYYFRNDVNVVNRVRDYLNEHSKLNISIITYYEILAGLEHKNAYKKIIEFEGFTERNRIIVLTNQSAKFAAIKFGELKRKGIEIGTSDLLIAGIAIENDLQLITNNEKHFEPIEDLQIENWKK